MTDRLALELVINTLKERLKLNGDFIDIVSGEGSVKKVTFQFHPPCSEDELDDFMNQYDLVLPTDYYRFLLMHDGAELFYHPYYGGEFTLFNINAIIDIMNNRDFPNEWLMIGYHYGQDLLIDMERVINGRKNYMLYRDSMASIDEAHDMGLDFETWFTLVLENQGESFWVNKK